MPSEMINTVIMFEKEKADDTFWLETEGLDEDDVDHTIKVLKLEKDEEYLKIQQQWKEKSEQFLKERAQEAEKAMK